MDDASSQEAAAKSRLLKQRLEDCCFSHLPIGNMDGALWQEALLLQWEMEHWYFSLRAGRANLIILDCELSAKIIDFFLSSASELEEDCSILLCKRGFTHIYNIRLTTQGASKVPVRYEVCITEDHAIPDVKNIDVLAAACAGQKVTQEQFDDERNYRLMVEMGVAKDIRKKFDLNNDAHKDRPDARLVAAVDVGAAETSDTA
ncbi:MULTISPECIES: hypothetical protein [unclassified Neorhizobium]|uniref:hypothetical protein n=1 Tax=unclassified Neorhizobium TaxID=2629175 RepID=UPI001FF12293|nr:MULTISPECIES: hypothetical protein [unclassified Neorhizobium]MCJ9674100.1 hypothetical protein [Neorhizobium sp. SHOUNA12B]MCJ9746278.1 hypothetical protein [Neorhizobium sp. SHOUNA12A]